MESPSQLSKVNKTPEYTLNAIKAYLKRMKELDKEAFNKKNYEYVKRAREKKKLLKLQQQQMQQQQLPASNF
jgi:hypothetical protein